jgi:sortase system peptidoglycan-associated protein
MIKQTSLALVFTVIAASASADTQRAHYQNPSSKEETTGFLGGAVLGGLAGGPPGVILGAAFGAMFGDGWRAKSELGDLQATLYETKLRLAVLQEESNAMQTEHQLAQARIQELTNSRASAFPVALSMTSGPCCDNTLLSLNFRSGSSKIESHYQEQLQSLINIAKQMPAASVEITGYADRNGDPDFNLKLSRERSNSVKQFFSSKGLNNSSIRTIAYGETQPLHSTQDVESDFFDRRVVVRLSDNRNSMLSQTPDVE